MHVIVVSSDVDDFTGVDSSVQSVHGPFGTPAEAIKYALDVLGLEGGEYEVQQLVAAKWPVDELWTEITQLWIRDDRMEIETSPEKRTIDGESVIVVPDLIVETDEFPELRFWCASGGRVCAQVMHERVQPTVHSTAAEAWEWAVKWCLEIASGE